MVRPAKGKKFPAVIVIHENRGLVPHIQEVTKRMAKEGFLSLAPDALSPVGGTPEDVSNAGALFKQLNSEETTKNFVAAVKYLKTHPLSTGKVGCTGFCWGGAMTNQVAVNSPDLDAAVPYYGRQPISEDVEKIKAPVMAHYAENDQGINAGIQAFEEALKKYGKEYKIFMYEGAGHAFNNDSNPDRYNEKAAKLAWERTIGFFKEKLGS
jgi:carboxymethylenebutenolidase